jgi:hypothetical protein
MIKQPPELPSQEELVHQIQNGRWQERAMALFLIHKHKLFAQWPGPRGVPYKSFPYFCADIGSSGQVGYDLGKIAADPRFPLIFDLDMNIGLARELIRIPQDNPLFEILALLMELGETEDFAYALMASNPPLTELTQLVETKIKQKELCLRRLKKIIRK